MRHFVLCFALLVSTAASADSYTRTKYPIVLVHGFDGFDSLLGVMEYFYGITGELREGGATVYVADVSAVNSSEARGEQLITQLETLRALYGHDKFNLIGHSHGGPTIRYVASVRPDLVASVTGVGSPNTGSPVVDGVGALTKPGTPEQALALEFVETLGQLIAMLSGSKQPQVALAAFNSLSTEGAARFNALYPEGQPTTPCGEGAPVVNGIRYYSFSGSMPLTNALDWSDGLLAVSMLYFGSEPNDGLVGRCSTHSGTVLRDDYGWNHFDEVNHVLGVRGVLSASPPAVFRAHANRLKSKGL